MREESRRRRWERERGVKEVAFLCVCVLGEGRGGGATLHCLLPGSKSGGRNQMQNEVMSALQC